MVEMEPSASSGRREAAGLGRNKGGSKQLLRFMIKKNKLLLYNTNTFPSPSSPLPPCKMVILTSVLLKKDESI